MTRTVAYDVAKWEAREWDRTYKSAVCSGILPDKRHELRGGFHVGRRWNPPGNFSIVRPDDRVGPDDGSAAIDMSMNKADMVLCTTRVHAVWLDKKDPRRKYFNAFNGWFGKGDAVRLDFVSGRKSRATRDHTWHCHAEGRRKWIKSKVAAQARISVYRGESKAEYLRSIGVIVSRAPKVTAVPPFPGAVLKRGSMGWAVKTWQGALLARGYKSLGKADGSYGPKCERATKTFQKACKLKPDGRVGPKTWPLAWTRGL